MIRSLQWWRVVAALASLSIGVTSLNSINLNFENLEDIDLSFLGTPNLDKYDANLSFKIEEREDVKGDDECIYTLSIDFDPSGKETPPGDTDFTGNCAPNDSQGNATDGLPWHAHRRHWIRLSEEIESVTGLNHLSMEWVPCGRAPAGFRQARWDFNFYTVSPEIRSFMVCDEFKTPSVCQYNQASHLGRSMFTVPRMARDPRYLVNLPLDFSPDPEFPEAFQYEGLTHYRPANVPNSTANWTLPTFLMTTHDAAAVSWRAMIPHAFFDGKYWVRASEYQYYVFQTMMGLPSAWRTEWNEKLDNRMYIEIEGSVIKGSSKICGGPYKDPIKKVDKPEIKIVFEDSGNAGKLKRAEDMH